MTTISPYQLAIRQKLSRMLRSASAPFRLSPDFMIIGAQRCGTTSLYRYLCQHPSIISAVKKEVHFFDLDFNKGENWYRSHFPLRLYKSYLQKVNPQVCLTGEATPIYLLHPLAPYRVSELLPNTKFIVLLRNPVDRAYSHYWLQVRRGGENLPFEQAIQEEPKRLRGQRERIILQNSENCGSNFWHYSYLARGIYIDQLETWHRIFPKEQFLILKSEDFYANSTDTLNQCFKFLGLSSRDQSHNTIHQHGKYPAMNPEIKARLNDYFRPYNERLYEFLGRDLGWEKE